MLKVLRRILLIALLAVGAAYLLYQGFLFWRALDKFPPTTVVADVPVGGLTLDAAREAINERYLAPVSIYNGDQRAAEIMPADVGFSIDTETMLAEAQTEWQKQEMWLRYVEFVIGLSPEPIVVDIRAQHDDGALSNQLNMVADFVDRPAQGPQLLADTGEIQPGQSGTVTDRAATLDALRAALYSPEDRRVDLLMIEEPARSGTFVSCRMPLKNNWPPSTGLAVCSFSICKPARKCASILTWPCPRSAS